MGANHPQGKKQLWSETLKIRQKSPEPLSMTEFMTAAEFARARRKLGLSARAMGEALGLRGDPGRTVRRYEAGETITGPIATATLALLFGFRPPWFPKDPSRDD